MLCLFIGGKQNFKKNINYYITGTQRDICFESTNINVCLSCYNICLFPLVIGFCILKHFVSVLLSVCPFQTGIVNVIYLSILLSVTIQEKKYLSVKRYNARLCQDNIFSYYIPKYFPRSLTM